MKFFALFTVILVFSLSTIAYAFRCGEGGRLLADEGMHKYEILKDCGAPVSKEVTAIKEHGDSIQKIEEWLYIVDEYGHKQMYLIKFNEKGIASKIDWLGEQK